MSNWWFSESVYKAVGKTMGYVVAPLSIMGFGLPLYLRVQESTQIILGLVHLTLCLLAILCNAYLICRKKRLGYGASMFPALVTLTAIPASFLLLPSFGTYWSAAVVILIVLFDFFGQTVLALSLGRAAGLTGRLRIDCF